MPNMYDFNDELMAHEASNEAFKFMAERIGIVVMSSKVNDEIIAIWIFKRQQPDGSFTLNQITCKSHSASTAIIGILKSIEELGKAKDLTIRLVGYKAATRIVKDKMFGK